MTIDRTTSSTPYAFSPATADSTEATADPADPDDDATAGLSPDALMTYCQARLGSIDSQVETAFGEQQTRNTDAQGIQDVLAQLQAHSTGVTDSTSCGSMESALHDLITNLQSTDPGCPQLPTLVQTYNNMVYSGTGPTADCPYIDQSTYPPQTSGPQGDGILSADEMTSYIDALQGCSSALDSGAELQMIQLQSLMSQRQTAISLTTNLVEALGDQANTIASNIGH